MSIEQFAAGVITVVNSTMEKAIRVVSIERGYDTREFALVAFGGAGALHACELASGLGIPTVIVPAMPGALSAYGILVSDIVKDYSRTLLLRAGSSKNRVGPGFQARSAERSSAGKRSLPLTKLRAEFKSMSAQALRDFRNESWKRSPRLERSADLRYRGQGFELNVPFDDRMLAAFHAGHRRRYGYSHPEKEVEIVTIRLRARGETPKLEAQPTSTTKHDHATFAQVWFDGRFRPTAIIDRAALHSRKLYQGPAVITEYSATTVVPPHATYKLDRSGNLLLQLNKKGAR